MINASPQIRSWAVPFVPLFLVPSSPPGTLLRRVSTFLPLLLPFPFCSSEGSNGILITDLCFEKFEESGELFRPFVRVRLFPTRGSFSLMAG